VFCGTSSPNPIVVAVTTCRSPTPTLIGISIRRLHGRTF
jgi:hypothetical protein